MPDWRPGFNAWLARLDGEGRLPPELREAGAWLLQAASPDPKGRWPSGSNGKTVEFDYLRRWPLDMRLGVLRILRDLEVIAALKSRQRETHDRLVAALLGEPQV